MCMSVRVSCVCARMKANGASTSSPYPKLIKWCDNKSNCDELAFLMQFKQQKCQRNSKRIKITKSRHAVIVKYSRDTLFWRSRNWIAMVTIRFDHMCCADRVCLLFATDRLIWFAMKIVYTNARAYSKSHDPIKKSYFSILFPPLLPTDYGAPRWRSQEVKWSV